jgi:hypothetical protein
VSQSDIDTYLTQQNAQLTNEFTAAWGIAAYIDTQPGGWPVYLLDNSDVAGALGYHDYANGSPFANIFVQTAKQAGVSWQSVASHEVLEMLADPGPTFKTATAPNGDVWDYEICDPVESDLDGSMSDFVFPAFFNAASSGPWDQDKVLSGPFMIAPGGYAVVNGQTVLGLTVPGRKYVDYMYRKRVKR